MSKQEKRLNREISAVIENSLRQGLSTQEIVDNLSNN